MTRLAVAAGMGSEAAVPGPSATGWTSAHRRVVVALFSSALAAAVAVATWPPVRLPLLALALLIAAMVLAVTGSATPWLVVPYVGLAGFGFLVAPLLNSHPLAAMAQPWALVALWFLAWAAGEYLTDAAVGGRRRMPPDRVESRRDYPVLAVLLAAVASFLVQLALLRQSSIGYGAQVQGLSSTGTSTVVGSVAPIAIATAYLMARIGGQHRYRLLTGVLVGAEALALATTGFRGSGPLFLITVWLTRKRWQPDWRFDTRTATRWILAVIAITALFSFGASRRAQVANLLGRSSAGTQAADLSSLPRVIINRFDFYPSVAPAFSRASSPPAKAAVSPRSELVAFVPRLLWPGKPTIDYGHQVAQAFFDIPATYRTSSSITWLGDLFVQGGWAAPLVVAVALGACIQRQVGPARRPSVLRIGVYFLVVQALLTLDSPLLISAAASLRTLLAFLAMCWAFSLPLGGPPVRRRSPRSEVTATGAGEPG
ncbi:MAG: hypothetical protein ABR511_06620 [Acidimicrobiales bacterium]